MYRDHRDKGYPDLPEDKMEHQPVKIEVDFSKEPLKSDMTRMGICNEILNERSKQDAKWGEQNHPVAEQYPMADLETRQAKERGARRRCQDREKSKTLSWYDICQEELCEANGAEDDEHAREELLQLAACCVAAIECIDRREAKKHDVKTCEDRNCLHPTCVAINGG